VTRPALASALHVALSQPEPTGPECYLCGSVTGPWLPDPSGARWPSGAQMLFCSRGCPESAEDTEHAAAKDTPRGASTLDSDVLGLLAAIRDAIDVPRAVLTTADEEARYHLLHQRAVSVRIALNSVIDRGAGLAGVIERLTERTAGVIARPRIARRFHRSTP
jgi:hypothetical protein